MACAKSSCQPAQTLRVGGHIAAGFADVDEQLKGLAVAAIGIDRDIGRANLGVFAKNFMSTKKK
jgi:hypothetical protein